MATPRVKPGPRKSLGAVLSDGRDALQERRGVKKLSFDTIARELSERYRIGVAGETVRVYHQDAAGEKKNALLIAGLMDLYGLSVADLPAGEAERIGLALRLLKRVTARRTPPGTRTRNLQVMGSHSRTKHPTSAQPAPASTSRAA